jgi:pyruvate-formate lyase-activating enzyme
MKLIVIPRNESHTPPNLPSPDELLERALALGLPPQPVPRRRYPTTTDRRITRRGVMWLGQTCNLRCHFCYFLDRIEDKAHPEHPFMALEKAKHICKTLVEVYGNNAIDIQGGEPTIWRHILPLVTYCREIGLYPTLITNALVLDHMAKVQEFKKAGVRDFLVSVHGLGPLHDMVVGLEGAHVKQMKALRNLAEADVPFRFNCVMSKAGILHLPQVAKLAVQTGANAVNFLTFNPFEDQLQGGVRSVHNVPRYTEVTGPLTEALDILAAAGVEANVRYFPPCMVPERHRKSMYNFPQLPYDHHEWDFGSWDWTNDKAQVVAARETSPPPPMIRELRPEWLRNLLRRLAQHPRLTPAMKRLEWGLRKVLAKLPLPNGRALTYRDYARHFAHQFYRYAPACQGCDARAICDGLHNDYADLFGQGEVRPIQLGFRLNDPTYYTRHQEKIVEPEDETWALPPTRQAGRERRGTLGSPRN